VVGKTRGHGFTAPYNVEGELIVKAMLSTINLYIIK